MVRLHLVGLTTDLKNLIFANERGATAGGFVVSLDSRLRHTLEEVARLEDEADPGHVQESGQAEASEPEQPIEPAPLPPKVTSKLTPKEIQSLLRQGKTEEQVARLAQTNVDWIRRFSFAILAERRDVIDAVRAATLSKPRLGLSGMNIGEAVEENLGAKRLRMGPQAMDDAWKAVRKNGKWQVSFEYQSRGQKRLARYSFDPGSRLVEPLNEIALDLGWRGDPRTKASSPHGATSPRVSGSIVKPTAARSSSAARPPVPKAAAPARATPSPPAGAGPRTPAGRAPGVSARPAARSAPPESAPVARKPRVSGSAASRIAAPAPRAPLPQSNPGPASAPRRRVAAPKPERARPTPAPPPSEVEEPRGAGGFTPGKPKADRPAYSSIPKVWRPSRRS